MKTLLSSFEAYSAMYEFLGEVYDTMENDTLGAVLESLRIQPDTGLPVNPAMKGAWMEILHSTDENPEQLSVRHAYGIMGEFIRKISLQIHTPGLAAVISYISLHENDPLVLKDWEAAIGRAPNGDWE